MQQNRKFMGNSILQVPDHLRLTARWPWYWEHLPTISEAAAVHKELGGQIGGVHEDWPVEYVCLRGPWEEPWIVMHFDQHGLDDVLVRGAATRERPGDGSRWISPGQYGEFRDIIINARRFLYPRFLAGDMTVAPADGMTKSPYGGVIYTVNGVLHRADGPAYAETYRLNGAVHSNEGWFRDGEVHRAGDEPAYRTADTTYEWMKHGLPHRVNGPAHIRKFKGETYVEDYYIDGIKQNPPTNNNDKT